MQILNFGVKALKVSGTGGKKISSSMSSVKVGKERIILNLYLYRFFKCLSCAGNF